MNRRWLSPVLALALLAGPLAAVVCAAGHCALAEPMRPAHCAMTVETGTALDTAVADCCSDLESHDALATAQGSPIPVRASGGLAAVVTVPQPPAVAVGTRTGLARGAPTQRLHQLGALLL